MSLVTAEMIENESTKARLQKFWKRYRAKHNEDPTNHRSPDTCVGFLTKEKLHELYSNPDPYQLVIGCGLALIDNDEVAFFTDDGTFGLNVIPQNFGRCTMMLHYYYGEGNEYPNVDAIIERFFKGKRFLNSLDELVDYINAVRGYLDA